MVTDLFKTSVANLVKRHYFILCYSLVLGFYCTHIFVFRFPLENYGSYNTLDCDYGFIL